MEHRRHSKNMKKRSSREEGKRRAQTGEIASIGEFRAKYLPKDAKAQASHRMTPEEVGEDLARTSLTAAKQVLAGREATVSSSKHLGNA
jgi:hypothetical protein